MNKQSINFTFTPHTVSKNRTQVLIIEDDPQWRLILSKTIGAVAENINIVYAETGSSARSLLGCRSFDLVVSDFMLDGNENGVEIWRSTFTELEAPFVLISGKPAAEIYRRLGRQIHLPLVLSKLAPKDQLKAQFEYLLSKI